MSTKLTVTEAVAVIPVSESTLRRDLKAGKVSFETDAKGRTQIDVSELTRVYGQLRTQNGTHTTATSENAEPANDARQSPSLNGNDSATVIAVLENRVADLTAQLEKADAREHLLYTEKSTLLDLIDRLQKQNEVLMLPPPKEKVGWVQRIRQKVFRGTAGLSQG